MSLAWLHKQKIPYDNFLKSAHAVIYLNFVYEKRTNLLKYTTKYRKTIWLEEKNITYIREGLRRYVHA